MAELALPLISVTVVLLAFAGFEIRAFALAGVFEYPLDDVYIHLDLANHIAQGTYGLNAGEPTSPSSSILYPFLLVPFAGTALQRFVPLILNVFAATGTAFLWGKILNAAGLNRALGTALAVLGPIGLNMAIVAFTGMENELHAFFSLLLLLGLARYLKDDVITGWFVAAAILSPLVRYEGLTLSLCAVGVLAVTGRARAAGILGAGVLLPIVAFSTFLVRIGLSPVPSPILVKADAGIRDLPFLLGPWGQLHANLEHPNRIGLLLAAMALLLAVIAWMQRADRQKAILPLVVAIVGLAHLMFGRIGYIHRYEQYVLVLEASALVLSIGRYGFAKPAVAALTGLVVSAVALLDYGPVVLFRDLIGPRDIHLQQAQMARFVTADLKAPVAANDIGWISWKNPNYVLDLWGLASPEARKLRLSSPSPAPGWAGPLAREHGVVAAMIFDNWLGPAVGPDWVPLAHLTISPPHRGFIGGFDVTFYATNAANVSRVVAALRKFAPTVPAGAHLRLIGPAVQ